MTHSESAPPTTPDPPLGLEGVIAARTRLSAVDGAKGQLTIAGFSVEDFAPGLDFETAVFTLWNDRLPSEAEATSFRAELRAQSEIPPAIANAITHAARRGGAAIDTLRLGITLTALEDAAPQRLLASLPGFVVLHAHATSEPGALPQARDGSLAHNYLFGLRGTPPQPAEVRALETYLNTVIDHGLNASAFTARVIASTGSDVGAALEGGLAALKGPLHGGAPGPALEALLRLRQEPGSLETNTRRWVREEVAAGRRIMGFGHRVYRVRDPRADVLAAAAGQLLNDTSLAADAVTHERAVLETLRELKPQRALATNVEFYTALLLHGLGLPASLFTPTFAIARAAGWIAHVREQQAVGRLIRPRGEYRGEHGRSLAHAPVRA